MRKSNSLKLLLSALLMAIGCNVWGVDFSSGATFNFKYSSDVYSSAKYVIGSNEPAAMTSSGSNTSKYWYAAASSTFTLVDGNSVAMYDGLTFTSGSTAGSTRFYYNYGMYLGQAASKITINGTSLTIGQKITIEYNVTGDTNDKIKVTNVSGNIPNTEGKNVTQKCTLQVTTAGTNVEISRNGQTVEITKIVIGAAPTDPIITADASVELAADATSGVISYTVINPDGSTMQAAEITSATWVSNVVVDAENNKVTFSTEANTGAARSATIRLTYGSVTKDVIVNQIKYKAETATLPFAVVAGISGAELKLEDGISGSWDNKDYSNDDHKVKFSSSSHNMVVKTDSRIGSCTFSVKGCAGKGSSSITIQESANGTDWADVQTFTVTFDAKDEVKEIIVTNAFEAASRYVKLKFNKPSGDVNFGLGQFTINKYATPVVLAVSDAKYATYFNSTTAYIMPENLEGITVDGVEDNTLSLTTTYEAGDVVPAGEALVLHGATGNYDLVACITYYTTKSEENMLKGTSTAEEETTGGDKYYRLSQHDGQVGFYWGAAEGAAFQPGANKAYLAVSGTNAPARFIFGQQDVPTEVVNVNDNNQSTKVLRDGRLYIVRDGNMFDLNGRLVK